MAAGKDILEFAKKLAEGARSKALADHLRLQAIRRAALEREHSTQPAN